MKKRQYVLSCKKRKWENTFIKCLEFKNEFLSFEKNKDHIPFRYVSRMHFSEDTIIHFFQQYIFLVLILDIVFGIRHYTFSIDNIQIKKVDFDQAFFFILDEKYQIYMDCPYGYHIYISGFEECFFKGVEHPLYIKTIPCNWNRIESFTTILRKNVDETFRKMLSHFKPVIFDLKVESNNELFFILCPLINVKHTNIDEDVYTRDVIFTEITKSFQIFLKEYTNLEKQFSNVERSKIVLQDWIDILCFYKRDFFQNPDMTLGILRKVFYQYLVDNSLSYITFKTVDMTKFIVSLYLWSQWYERVIYNIPLWEQTNIDLVTIIGCIDVYFKKQKHHQPKSLHIYDFISKSVTIKECPQGIDRVHPLLRTKYIENKILSR